MNIFKGILSFAAVSAVLTAGCVMLYDDGTGNAKGADVYAEEYPDITASSESALVTVPISAFDSGALPEYNTVTFTFLGDCILASDHGDTREDSFEACAKRYSSDYFFEKAVPYYEDSDFVVANSEFVMSDSDLAKVTKEEPAFWFKAPADRTELLKAGRINIVTLANNHTEDYDKRGYEDTISSLESAGISWGDLENPVYVKKNGITFGILCTKLFSTNYEPLVTPAVEEIVQNSDIQIMYFHGGEEGSHVPESWLKELCHKYADMGIDLIVGSHPHVLRPMEEYNGTDIVYSLGNFCYGANRTPENRTVMLTETFTFDEDGNFISSDECFIPFYVYTGSHNNWQPAPIEDPDEYSKVLSFMYGSNDLPY